MSKKRQRSNKIAAKKIICLASDLIQFSQLIRKDSRIYTAVLLLSFCLLTLVPFNYFQGVKCATLSTFVTVELTKIEKTNSTSEMYNSVAFIWMVLRTTVVKHNKPAPTEKYCSVGFTWRDTIFYFVHRLKS